MALSNLSDQAKSERSMHNQHMLHADFDQAPFTIAWEVTRACAYACVHCRADAQHHRDPRELSTEEARGLIDRFAAHVDAVRIVFEMRQGRHAQRLGLWPRAFLQFHVLTQID